ncbi:CRP-like cAMP-binding protein [Spinactinospora alkalitolerans]|uniref:CRP-like cAMP-binding protein n=1 Tax=Spinactinospora alkalitolerans TaxID=687207 RepID=A0A852TR18_9ACTN|nr:Crp/Fnr family transcriptional regulator [Spinactinospora alkalitolerans]NYE46001.1 CRP-like cAMP-binding protein [Spinactinospora alkalitolerans]
MTDEQWRRMAGSGSLRRYVRGEPIMRQGEPGTTVHLVMSGVARVSMLRPEGTEVPLAFRGVGELLGEPSLWSGQARGATVVATAPCETRVFLSDRFRRSVQKAGLESAVWQSILTRQRESDELRAEQSMLSAGRRLATALLRLADTLGEPIEPGIGDAGSSRGRGTLLDIALPQQEIADYIGLSRTSVALEYARLKELGVIRTGRNHVAIHDHALLTSLARGDA